DLGADVQGLERLFQDVGHVLLLKDAALDVAGEQPQLGHDLGPVLSMELVAQPLTEAADDAVEVAVVAAPQCQANPDLLAQELLERNVLAVLGQEGKLKAKELGNAFTPCRPSQPQDFGSQV